MVDVGNDRVLEAHRRVAAELRRPPPHRLVAEPIGQVRRQAARRQRVAARPFADQINNHFRLQTIRNLLGQLDAAVACQDRLAAAQAAPREAVLEDRQQLLHVVMHGLRAQPVRDDHLHLLVLRLQKGLALGREVRAEVG